MVVKSLKNTVAAFAFLILMIACIPLSAQHSRVNQDKLDSIAEAKSIVRDTIVPFLVNKVQTYSFVIKRDNNLIQRTVDLGDIQQNLPSIQKRLTNFNKRMNKKGRKMNLRSLNSSTIMLKESLKLLTTYETTLTTFYNDLSRSNKDLSKISDDPILKTITSDSALNNLVSDLKDDAQDLDSAQKYTIAKIALTRNKVSLMILQANDMISELSYRTITLKREMWEPEDEPFFNDRPKEYDQSLLEVIGNAMKRSGKNTLVFLSNKWNIIMLALLIFTLTTVWTLSNMRRVKKQEDASAILELAPLLKRSAILGGCLSLLIAMPFFFANPQMSFLHICELLRLIVLSILIYPFLTKASKPVWLVLSAIWLYYAIDDLLLESAYGERVMLLLTGVLFISICVRIIRNKNGHFITLSESPATKALAIFCLIQMAMSIFFNLTGRIALTKIFGVSAVQCLVLGATLKVFSTIVIEAIYLQTEAYQESRFSEFINFKELEHRFRRTLWIIASLVWLMGLIRNLTLYDYSIRALGEFFGSDRKIGSMVFTYKSVAIFIGIIWLSSIISGFINFFFGHEKTMVTGKKKQIGSMMLLIRLAIWSIGFLVAFAAAGIPLDKISIMLGALGVGIGFGLQNIANNLVSGIILAFERPIQVGDQIEIGNKSGVVKEIGVRSSKLKGSDGSDIIIPNGDLLSQHLINWTMQDNSKRIEFTIGVSYKADILQVKNIIQQTLESNEDILQTPAPAILLQTFADSALEVKVAFWVPDLSKAGSIRSQVMMEVYKRLSDDGIDLPYPIKKD
jgi:small-conductance mechanosensitive channel